MGRHPRRLVAEAHAARAVPEDVVAAEEVVRVLVPDRDPELAVLLEAVVLEHTVADAPAEEQPVGAIATGQAVPDDGPLRAAAGVQTQVGIVLTDAGGDRHVVGLLEADPIAVVVSHHAALDDRAETCGRNRCPPRGSR